MSEIKVLGINNTIFYEEGNSLFLNSQTGIFFEKLKDLGNTVSLFQISQLKTNRDAFANFDIRNKGIYIYEVKRRKSRIVPFIKSFFLIQNAILRNDFVYIFYPGPICQIIGLLCIFYRRPFGLYVRGEKGLSTYLSKIIFKKADIVFTISPNLSKKLSRFNLKTQTIRPMIGFNESDFFESRKIDLKDCVKLLYVGRLVYDKGIFELVDALERLSKDGDYVLNIAGSGTDSKDILGYVRKKGLEDRVNFLGMVSDHNVLKNIFIESDIFILPTYHEGFPRVLYEAMIMRMPIVTTFVGNISFLMKDSYNCLEIFPKDAQSIVNAILKLKHNPKLAEMISNNGLKTIKSYLFDKRLDHASQLNCILNQIS